MKKILLPPALKGAMKKPFYPKSLKGLLIAPFRVGVAFLFFLPLGSGLLFAQVPGACGGSKNPVPMNGNAQLGGPIYTSATCGLNYVAVSKLIETRFNQYTTAGNNGSGLPTNLTVAGIPAGATIVKAYVWYLVSYIAAAPQASSVVLTNPVPATSTIASAIIGQDQGKCWGETGTANYRADVTAAITGNGTYNINITGITGTSGNFANWYDQIDGLTLFIVYQDNSATYLGSIFLWDGDMTGVGNTYTQTMTGIQGTGCGNPINAKAFLIVSDMQDNVNANMHPSTLNGVTITTFPNDFYNFDQANTTVTGAQTTATFGTDGLGSDCFDWAMMGLYYQNASCTPVSFTVTPTNSTCGQPNGSAMATASSANPPYTYSWSTAATTSSVSNLAAGNYSISVSDATGCSTLQTFTIATTVGPAVTFTATATKCNAGNDGAATLTASGGTAPYTYTWAIIPVQTTVTATGLAAGTYSVQVGDASGCSATYTVAVTQPTALAATTTFTPTQCTANIGTATANPSGGTSPYTYSWNTVPAQNSQTATGLGVATYSVTITDANGCTKTYSQAVSTQAPTLTATASLVNNVKCFGNSDGNAMATAGGGTAPYTYGWTPSGQTTQTASGLGVGTYSVMITDANGCTKPSSVTITQPTQVTLSQSTTTASCGISDGSATATAAGGTLPYTYVWLTSPVQNGQTLNNLSGGTYNVLVTDANGCNQSMSVVVPQFGPPAANFISNPADTVNLLDAIVSFYDGSVNAYTWSWNFDDPLSGTNNFSSLENPYHIYYDTGTYCITLIVTDPKGVCVDTTVHCVRVEAPFTFYAPNAFTPNGDAFNEYFTGTGTYIIDFNMWIFDRWGNLVWSCHTNGNPQMDKRCSWDGKVRSGGQQVQEDVYVWKVELTDASSKPHKYIGRLSMVK